MQNRKSNRESRKFQSRKFFFYSTRSIAAILHLPDVTLAEAIRSGKLRSRYVLDVDQPIWHFGQAREIVETLKNDLSKQDFANSMCAVAVIEESYRRRSAQ